jgi:hypothetical protein
VSCEPERVTGFVDGELDAAGMTEVGAHIESCAACRAQAAAERELRARLRYLPGPALTAGLEERLRTRTLRGARPSPMRFVLPVAALLLIGVWVRGYAPFVAWELVRDHRHCFSMTPLPAQVRSGEPQVVSAWFEGRGTRLPSLPQEAGGAHLVGGRYCRMPSLTLSAHVYYASPGGGVSVFLVPQRARVDDGFSDEMGGETVRLAEFEDDVLGVVGADEGEVQAVEQALRPALTARLEPRP